MTAYMVLHSVLGAAGHRAGEVVEFTDDHINKMGVDIERLLSLGAIREATASEAEDKVTYGDSGAAEIIPFPPVPYVPTAPSSSEISQAPEASAEVPADATAVPGVLPRTRRP